MLLSLMEQRRVVESPVRETMVVLQRKRERETKKMGQVGALIRWKAGAVHVFVRSKAWAEIEKWSGNNNRTYSISMYVYINMWPRVPEEN